MTVREEAKWCIQQDGMLAEIRKKIRSGKATYEDTAAYSARAGKMIGALFSRRLPEIPPEEREQLCVDLLHDQYIDINAAVDAAQRYLDERLGIQLAPQHAPFDSERGHQIGSSLRDLSKPVETLQRRAKAATETTVKSMHDDRMKTEAKFRHNAGLNCFITRKAVSGCCAWCTAMAGRYAYGEEPDDIYRRHDNCDCTVTFENGRKRQDVWSKRTWEAPAEGAGAGEPINFIGREVPQKGLTILSENGTIKAEGSAFDALNRKISSSSISQDLKAVNPNFEENTPYGKNCQRCVPTFVLRRRGYNVTALPDGGDPQIDDYLKNHPEAVWKRKGSPIIPTGTRGSKYFGKPEIERFMKELPEGAMCEIRFTWSNKDSGHVFIALKTKGKIKYIDPQNGLEDAAGYFKKMEVDSTSYWRIDDAAIDEKWIPYCCK